MTNYKYKAKNEEGKTVSGVLPANDEVELHAKLKNDKLFLISAEEIIETKSAKRLKSNVVSEFARNIGKLVGAGVSLVKALRIISEDESTDPKHREIYATILKSVRAGNALSDAIAEQGDAFPPLFINMIRSAEVSGNMDKVAMQMADYYDKEYRLSGKIKSSMTYPKILGVMIVLVVIIIMGYVIPQFNSMFESMDKLPLATSILLGISNFIKKRWYVLLFAAVVIYLVTKLLFSMPKMKYQKDKFLVNMPKIGKLMRIIYTARFARTLSSLYSAGISIINCLTIARTTIGNTYIEAQFDGVIAEVRAGGNLSEALDKVDGFTKKLISSVKVGEETGALDQMLVSIADQMEFDSEMALDKLVAMLEPLMIVVMAVVVGFIMIAIIKPIYGSYQAISNSH